jgi:hypothetical protein
VTNILTLHPKDGIELLAVEVPEEMAEPHFYRVNNESIMFKWKDVVHPLNPYDVIKVDHYRGDLELYKWPEFIATTKTITEEQAKELTGTFSEGYNDYCDSKKLTYLLYAKDSLLSFIRFKGGNPDKNTYAILKRNNQ